MTGMRASVRNMEEADLACRGGVDVVDLKEPREGALGAVPLDTIHRIVDELWEKCLISATIGDMPANPFAIKEQVMKTAEAGVDYVKVGMFSQRHVEDCLPALASCSRKGIAIIAVLFADTEFDVDDVIRSVKHAGLKGVMLDTAGKGSGSLLEHQNIFQLEYFVNHARQSGLLTGLAGSLTTENIPTLIRVAPDYIGFRTALCSDRERVGCVDREALREVRRAIPVAPEIPYVRTSSS